MIKLVGIRMRVRSLRSAEGKRCPYCAVTMTRWMGNNHWAAPSHDHIDPKSRGGSNLPDNLTICCRRCNEAKGSLDAEEFMAWREGRASRLDKPSLNMDRSDRAPVDPRTYRQRLTWPPDAARATLADIWPRDAK